MRTEREPDEAALEMRTAALPLVRLALADVYKRQDLHGADKILGRHDSTVQRFAAPTETRDPPSPTTGVGGSFPDPGAAHSHFRGAARILSAP